MAQKTGQEETEFKVVSPETLTLCVNNCGFTGNPATKNMCQKCFNNNNNNAMIIASHNNNKPPESSRSTPSRSPELAALRSPAAKSPAVRDLKRPDLPAPEEAFPAKREVNRCSGCRKKVGLTGFRCRCGELFCSDHRYSDRHDCSFDYKAAGREAIERENPVVKAAKIIKL